MSLYLAAYDISSDKRRRNVASVLQAYGHRIQASVFEVWLEPHEVPELRGKVGMLLAPTDAFEIAPLDDRGTRSRHRWQRELELWSAVLMR